MSFLLTQTKFYFHEIILFRFGGKVVFKVIIKVLALKNIYENIKLK